MFYACVHVCLVVNGKALSFDPNNARSTQNINEGTGSVINYIQPKSVQNWLKNQFFKKGLVYFILCGTVCFS